MSIPPSFRCYFGCAKRGEDLITITNTRIQTIISTSHERGDKIQEDLTQRLSEDEKLTIRAHKSCVSTYNSKQHISRLLKKRSRPSERCESEPPIQRRRSQSRPFAFSSHCIICGDICMPFDERHPDRHRKVTQVKHAFADGRSFKEYIDQVCCERGDELSKQVQVRMSGAVADLHAVNAQYHRDCMQKFFSKRNKNAAQPKELKCDSAFTDVIVAMESDKGRVWSTVDLYALYTSGGNCDPLCRRQFISNMLDHFGDDILEMKVKGCASLICFKAYIPYKLHADDDCEYGDNLHKVVQKINKEVKQMPKPKDYMLKQFIKENSIQTTSPTLLQLISQLISNGEVSRESLSLAQCIQSQISKKTTPTTLGIGVKLHHMFGSKDVITLLHEYGFSCTYDEVLRFRTSAAEFIGEREDSERLQLQKNAKPISTWYDNYDLVISTPNGMKECHGMAIEHMQEPDTSLDEDTNDIIIPRLSNHSIKQLHLIHCI